MSNPLPSLGGWPMLRFEGVLGSQTEGKASTGFHSLCTRYIGLKFRCLGFNGDIRVAIRVLQRLRGYLEQI